MQPLLPGNEVVPQLVYTSGQGSKSSKLVIALLVIAIDGQTQSLPAPPSVVKVYFFNFLKLQRIEDMIFKTFWLPGKRD